jgi:hypothetical protein
VYYLLKELGYKNGSNHICRNRECSCISRDKYETYHAPYNLPLCMSPAAHVRLERNQAQEQGCFFFNIIK